MTAAPCNPVQLLEDLSRAPVEERAGVLRAMGPIEVTLGALIDHAAQLTAVDASKAVDATDIVVNLADRVGSQLDRARARRARARALSYTGRFEDALVVAREGARLAEEAGFAIEAGRARLASMHALGEMGRLEEAIRTGETAREAFLAAGEPALAARADINLGTAHQRRDELADAVDCFDRARPFLQNEPLVLGHLENNRGEALVAMNDFAGAEAAFTSALASFQSANATLTAAIAEGNLADLAARRGLLHKSLYHFERARRRLESDAAAGHAARLIAEQADALSVLGMPREAMQYYDDALPHLDRCGLALEAARARAGMGAALMRLHRFAEAETALAAAAAAFEDLGHRTLRGRVDLLRAELALAHGRAAEARTLALRALAMTHDRPVETAAARRVLARVASNAGRFAEAHADLSIGLTIAKDLDLAPLQADLLLARGILNRRQNRVPEAIHDLTEAVAQVERLRGSLQAERFRTALQGDRASAYEQLTLALLEQSAQGSHDDAVQRAFGVVEQAKSRALLDRMRGVFEAEAEARSADDGASALDEDSAGAERRLLADAARVRAELNALYSRFHDEHPSHAAGNATWRQAVRQREAELDALENRLSATRGFGGLFVSTATLGEVQAILDRDTILVEYFIADDELMAFAVTHDAAQVFRHLAKRQDVLASLKRVQFQMNRALRPGSINGERAARLIQDAQRELKCLYELTLEPLHDVMRSARRLIVVPHDVLHMVPFHALWDGQQYLIQSTEIRSVPSCSLLLHLRARAARATPKHPGCMPAVVGVSDRFAPHIADEASEIAAMLQCPAGRVLVGEQATLRRVRAAAPNASILHLACHGRFVADTPQGSGLKLADGWLTVRDICGLNLHDARLVTLSGCETGMNRIEGGDELMGALRGFFAAGAASLLVSLWRVDDVATRSFMVEFYRRYVQCHQPATALRGAQLAMLGEWNHPALWAPFMLVGGVE